MRGAHRDRLLSCANGADTAGTALAGIQEATRDDPQLDDEAAVTQNWPSQHYPRLLEDRADLYQAPCPAVGNRPLVAAAARQRPLLWPYWK